MEKVNGVLTLFGRTVSRNTFTKWSSGGTSASAKTEQSSPPTRKPCATGSRTWANLKRLPRTAPTTETSRNLKPRLTRWSGGTNLTETTKVPARGCRRDLHEQRFREVHDERVSLEGRNPLPAGNCERGRTYCAPKYPPIVPGAEVSKQLKFGSSLPKRYS